MTVVLSHRFLYFYHKDRDPFAEPNFKYQLHNVKVRLNRSPTYLSRMPPLPETHSTVLEIVNEKSLKRKILGAPGGVKGAETWVTSMNLVASLTTYIHFCRSQNKLPDPYLREWVEVYEQHNGVFKLGGDQLTDENRPFLTRFLRNNAAIAEIRAEGVVSEEQVFVLSNILKAFDKYQLTRLSLINCEFDGDGESLGVLNTALSHQECLERLEVAQAVFHDIECAEWIRGLGRIFPLTPSLRELILENVGLDDQGFAELFQAILEFLDPREVSVAENLLTDESIETVVKYTFSKVMDLKVIDLSRNRFSERAASKVQDLQMIVNPLPLNEDLLKYVLDEKFAENASITLQRRALSGVLKPMPTKAGQRAEIALILDKVESMVKQEERASLLVPQLSSGTKQKSLEERKSLTLEDIKDVVDQIYELPYEFPLRKLEGLLTLIKEKAHQAVKASHLYTLEISLICLRKLGVYEPMVESTYARLSNRAAIVKQTLLGVLNMNGGKASDSTEMPDPLEMSKQLDWGLEEAKEIGLRGQLLDACIFLKLVRDKMLADMRERGLGEVEGGAALPDEFADNDEDDEAAQDVFDPQWSVFIGKNKEQLGLGAEMTASLGLHPLNTDYLALSELSREKLRSDLREAATILRQEESYGFRNVHDRGHSLLGPREKRYALTRNDNQLKLARLVFRYRFGIDHIFEPVLVPGDIRVIPPEIDPLSLENDLPEGDPEETMHQYSFLIDEKTFCEGLSEEEKKVVEEGGVLAYFEAPLHCPLTKMDRARKYNPIAVSQAKILYQISAERKTTPPTEMIQSYFKEIVRLWCGGKNSEGRGVTEEERVKLEELGVELYLQIYRVGSQQLTQDSFESVFLSLVVMALLSSYVSPSREVRAPLVLWLESSMLDIEEFEPAVRMALRNFGSFSKYGANRMIPWWVPASPEIELLLTPDPFFIQIETLGSPPIPIQIEPLDTILDMVEKVLETPQMQLIPERETYWLYERVPEWRFERAYPREAYIMQIISEKEMHYLGTGGGADGDNSDVTTPDAGTSRTPREQDQEGKEGEQEEEGIQNAEKEEEKKIEDSRRTTARKSTYIRHTMLRSRHFGTNGGASTPHSATLSIEGEDEEDQEELENLFLLKKRVFQSVYRTMSLQFLPDETLKAIFHQMRLQHVSKGIYQGFMSPKEATSLAVIILTVLKAPRDATYLKDAKPKADYIRKMLPSCLPKNFLLQKVREQWVENIEKASESEVSYTLHDVLVRGVQAMAKYEIAFASYFHFHLLDQTHSLQLALLQVPLNSFVALTAQGILFLDDIKKNTITTRIRFHELLYVGASGDIIKLAVHTEEGERDRTRERGGDPDASTFSEVRLEFRCARAREFVEDLLSLCQLDIIENLPPKINIYAKPFDPAAFAEIAEQLRQALAEQLRELEAPLSQPVTGQNSKGQINTDNDDLEYFVPRFKKGAQAKTRRESDGSLLQLLDPQNLGEADRELIEQASPPELDIHSLEENETYSRLTVLYTFKPSFTPIFKKSFPLFRKTDLPLSRKPRNIINQSEIVRAIANFDPQASSLSEDMSSILTPVESARTSQVTTPSAQSAIPFSAFNKDQSSTSLAAPPLPPALEPSPSFGTLDPNITSPSNNMQDLDEELQQRKETPGFFKKQTGEFGDMSIENFDSSKNISKTKSEGDLMQKPQHVMEGSSSLGRIVRGTGRETLQVLEEAPGEEDSETRSSPSRKGDKRDTIISTRKNESSLKIEQELSQVKSVPIGKGDQDKDESKAEEMARTAPARKPQELTVDDDEYSSNKGVEKQGDNKVPHLALDSPHSDMLLKSINTEDLAKLDEGEIDSKRPSGTPEMPHIKSQGKLEPAKPVIKEVDEEQKRTGRNLEEEEDEDDEEEEDDSQEQEELPRMRPEQAIVMSIAQNENTGEEEKEEVEDEKKEQKQKEEPKVQEEPEPVSKELDDLLGGALSEFPDF